MANGVFKLIVAILQHCGNVHGMHYTASKNDLDVQIYCNQTEAGSCIDIPSTHLGCALNVSEVL